MNTKYMWVGLELPKHYETKVRREAINLNVDKSINEVAFLLPQHISLRISFQTDMFEELIFDLVQYFEKEQSFFVEHLRVDTHQGIVWSVFKHSTILEKFHSYLIEFPFKKYDIKPHEIDLSFSFHSTIFYDPLKGRDELQAIGDTLNNVIQNEKLRIKKVLIGLSNTGKPGSFKIVKRIGLK